MVADYAMGTGSSSLRSVGEGASESTRRVHDTEVRELADEAFRTAVALLDSHRTQLDELATTLLSNEVLERDDIEMIMGDVPPAAPSRRAGKLSVAAATALHPASPPRRRP
jgi:ATP-dependent Zn protease